MPNHYEDYVHRVGRCGRAGNAGTAYTLNTLTLYPSTTPEHHTLAPHPSLDQARPATPSSRRRRRTYLPHISPIPPPYLPGTAYTFITPEEEKFAPDLVKALEKVRQA